MNHHSIKFWQSINEGLFKVEYLGTQLIFLKSCKGCHEVTQQKFLSNVSKIMAEVIRYSIFKTSSFMLCQNLIKTLYVLVVFVFLDKEFHPKCLQWYIF